MVLKDAQSCTPALQLASGWELTYEFSVAITPKLLIRKVSQQYFKCVFILIPLKHLIMRSISSASLPPAFAPDIRGHAKDLVP